MNLFFHILGTIGVIVLCFGIVYWFFKEQIKDIKNCSWEDDVN